MRLTFSDFGGFKYKGKFYEGISFGEKDFLEVWAPLAVLSKTGLKSGDPWFRDLSDVSVGCTLQSSKDVLRLSRHDHTPTVADIWECMRWISTRGAALSCLMNPTEEHPQGLPPNLFEIHEKSLEDWEDHLSQHEIVIEIHEKSPEGKDQLSQHKIFKELISDTPPTYVKSSDAVSTPVLAEDDSDQESAVEPASSSTAGMLDVVPETPPAGARDIPETPPAARLTKVIPFSKHF